MYNLSSDVWKFLIYSLTKAQCIENIIAVEKDEETTIIARKQSGVKWEVAFWNEWKWTSKSYSNIHTHTQNTKSWKMLILSVHFFDDNSQQKSTEIES